jgi:hypothetical protein
LFCAEMASSSGSIAMLKSSGDSGSPCFTLLVMGIFDVSPLASVKCVPASVYRSTTVSIKWLFTQNLFSPSLMC